MTMIQSLKESSLSNRHVERSLKDDSSGGSSSSEPYASAIMGAAEAAVLLDSMVYKIFSCWGEYIVDEIL